LRVIVVCNLTAKTVLEILEKLKGFTMQCAESDYADVTRFAAAAEEVYADECAAAFANHLPRHLASRIQQLETLKLPGDGVLVFFDPETHRVARCTLAPGFWL